MRRFAFTKEKKLRYQNFEEYDVRHETQPTYKSIQEAADDLLTNEELDMSAEKIKEAVLKLKAMGAW